MTRVASAELRDVRLLRDEEGGLMAEEGIATVSFYKGNFDQASETLLVQFRKVVSSNPWLAGRLVKTKDGVRLRHPANPSDAEVDSLFRTTSAGDATGPKLGLTTPYAKMCADMYGSNKGRAIVRSGSSAVRKSNNQPEPVALLTVSESDSPGEFSVVFSLSHAIGDGRTYYDVFNMLSPGSAVRELNPDRVASFSESMRDTCGRKELEWADSTSAVCMYTCSMLPAMMGCGGKGVTCAAYHLDPARVASAKAAGADADAGGGDDVPYVTTNDVLTSAFFNECGARIGMMGMDCRGRVKGIEEDRAGNYVTALTMDPETFDTPAAVRRMLSSTPYETTKGPLPGFCGWACRRESAKFAMITNWSSFAGDLVRLEGCELVVHLPVQNPANCVYDLMIPFAPGPGKVGVICWTVSTDEEGLREALPVGDCVSRDLFPPP